MSSTENDNQPEMVLVPRRATRAMIEAAWADALAEDAAGVWASMIEAWLAEQKGKVRDRQGIDPSPEKKR
jgi:hypothetical protein